MNILLLDIPTVATVLALHKEELLANYELTNHIVRRTNNLKMNIPVVVLPLFRNQLYQINDTVQDGISSITWLAPNLKFYLDNIDVILSDFEAFLKDIEDMMTCRIVDVTNFIGGTRLLLLPNESVDSNTMYQMNVEHRNHIEKILEIKSMSAEKAAVEIINKFVDRTNIPDYDEKGKRVFSLPLNEITTLNWRVEESKLIDKYDWLSFDRIYSMASYPQTFQEHVKLCEY